MRWAAPRARVGAGCESGQHSGPADGAVDEPAAQAREDGAGDQGAGGEDQLPFEGPAGVPEDVVGDGHRNSRGEACEDGNAECVAAVAGQGEDEFGHDALAQAGEQDDRAEDGTQEGFGYCGDEFAHDCGAGFADDECPHGPGQQVKAADQARGGWEHEVERDVDDRPQGRPREVHGTECNGEYCRDDDVNGAPCEAARGRGVCGVGHRGLSVHVRLGVVCWRGVVVVRPEAKADSAPVGTIAFHRSHAPNPEMIMLDAIPHTA